MSLFSKASQFARSPQGKKAMDQAKKLAKDPENKRKLEDLRRRLGNKQR